jgi:hypothetical protein
MPHKVLFAFANLEHAKVQAIKDRTRIALFGEAAAAVNWRDTAGVFSFLEVPPSYGLDYEQITDALCNADIDFYRTAGVDLNTNDNVDPGDSCVFLINEEATAFTI